MRSRAATTLGKVYFRLCLWREDGTVTAEMIKKLELVYSHDAADRYFMLYYRFYVDLNNVPECKELKQYGKFDLPAVRQPLPDGFFEKVTQGSLKILNVPAC